MVADVRMPESSTPRPPEAVPGTRPRLRSRRRPRRTGRSGSPTSRTRILRNFRPGPAGDETLRAQTQAELLKGVLPIVEAAEKAVEAVHSRPPKDPVRKGVELLERAIAAFLKEQGVEVVGTAGEAFRPEEHEAVAEAAPSPAAPDGHVAEVVQRGYSFPGGLRPAKVVVVPTPPEGAAPAEETEEVSDPAEPSR